MRVEVGTIVGAGRIALEQSTPRCLRLTARLWGICKESDNRLFSPYFVKNSQIIPVIYYSTKTFKASTLLRQFDIVYLVSHWEPHVSVRFHRLPLSGPLSVLLVSFPLRFVRCRSGVILPSEKSAWDMLGGQLRICEWPSILTSLGLSLLLLPAVHGLSAFSRSVP
jgi:hypothetical protein